MDYNVLTNMQGIETYSFSKLNSFSTCPYAFYVNYLADKNQKLKSCGNGFADCGTFAHEIFEKFGKGELLQFELKPTFLEGFDENVPYGVKLKLKNGYTKDLTEKYKSDCADFFERFNGFEGMTQIGAEEDFKVLVQINGKFMILRGIIDCILQDENGDYHIYDYKSKSAFKSEEELEEYARQLYFYSVWIKYKYGKYPKTMNFLQFRIDVLTTINFSENGLNETLNWIYDKSEEIENETMWLPACSEIDENFDRFYVDNLCNYRYSCEYSPNYINKEDC